MANPPALQQGVKTVLGRLALGERLVRMFVPPVPPSTLAQKGAEKTLATKGVIPASGRCQISSSAKCSYEMVSTECRECHRWACNFCSSYQTYRNWKKKTRLCDECLSWQYEGDGLVLQRRFEEAGETYSLRDCLNIIRKGGLKPPKMRRRKDGKPLILKRRQERHTEVGVSINYWNSAGKKRATLRLRDRRSGILVAEVTLNPGEFMRALAGDSTIGECSAWITPSGFIGKYRETDHHTWTGKPSDKQLATLLEGGWMLEEEPYYVTTDRKWHVERVRFHDDDPKKAPTSARPKVAITPPSDNTPTAAPQVAQSA